MLFGRSLYGGALYPRQVTAAGVVACGASASAKATAAFRDGSGTFATATVASGTGVRNVLPVALAARASAATHGTARVDFALAAVSSGESNSSGAARVDFFALADAVALAGAAGKIIRTIPQRIPSSVDTYALPEAEPQVYVYVAPARVMCYANPFATHWYVGRGDCAAQAGGEAAAAIIRAASCQAVGSAGLTGLSRADVKSAGALHGQALAGVDPLTTVAGIRYWDANAEPVGEALLSGEAYTYSVALAVGRASARDDANSHRAAAGLARCFGEARGSMERVQPQYASVTTQSRAEGGAQAHLGALAQARTDVTGAAAAGAKADLAARGVSAGAAAGVSNVVWLTANGTVKGQSGATASVHRGIYAGGTCPQAAGAAAAGRKQAAASVASNGLAAASGNGIFHPKVLCGGSATAVANLAALYRLAQRAAGVATAGALPVGTNRVNDAGQRLSSRVIGVGAERRFISITEPPRLIAVAGAARRLAA